MAGTLIFSESDVNRAEGRQWLSLMLDVITGLVPVIPMREAPRFSASGWPAQARP